MPQVLMINRKPETILSPKDFEDLVDKYMGLESANYYQNQIEQLSSCIRDLANYIDDKYILSDVEEVLRINGY